MADRLSLYFANLFIVFFVKKKNAKINNIIRMPYLNIQIGYRFLLVFKSPMNIPRSSICCFFRVAHSLIITEYKITYMNPKANSDAEIDNLGKRIFIKYTTGTHSNTIDRYQDLC